MTEDQPTSRQARFLANLRAQGVKPVNVLAPVEVHDIIKELARRTREGEDPERVLGSLYRQAGGKAPSAAPLPNLVVPDDLAPLAGETALAVRLTKKASGYIKQRVRETGLVRSEAVAGWVGVLPAVEAEDLARRVLAAGGSVVTREG